MGFKKGHLSFRFLLLMVVNVFIFALFATDLLRIKSAIASVSNLPPVGTLVRVSNIDTESPLLKGIRINPEKPLEFEFIVDARASSNIAKDQAEKLIKYFMATLTVPKADLWVNLSPYENDRIATDSLGNTDLGKGLLEQDYILKQLSASLTFPDSQLGKEYWNSVGMTFMPSASTSFNKIWIIPDVAQVYEKGDSAFITEASLKVMTEKDYVAIQNNSNVDNEAIQENDPVKLILPKITDEVNSGENFSELRQIYHSIILGLWFKRRFIESAFKHYIDQNKIKGIDIEGKNIKEEIFKQYVESFNKGVYDLAKKEYDLNSSRKVKRNYFSGGKAFHMTEVKNDGTSASAVKHIENGVSVIAKISSTLTVTNTNTVDDVVLSEDIKFLVKHLAIYDEKIKAEMAKLKDNNLKGTAYIDATADIKKVAAELSEDKNRIMYRIEEIASRQSHVNSVLSDVLKDYRDAVRAMITKDSKMLEKAVVSILRQKTLIDYGVLYEKAEHWGQANAFINYGIEYLRSRDNKMYSQAVAPLRKVLAGSGSSTLVRSTQDYINIIDSRREKYERIVKAIRNPEAYGILNYEILEFNSIIREEVFKRSSKRTAVESKEIEAALFRLVKRFKDRLESDKNDIVGLPKRKDDNTVDVSIKDIVKDYFKVVYDESDIEKSIPDGFDVYELKILAASAKKSKQTADLIVDYLMGKMNTISDIVIQLGLSSSSIDAEMISFVRSLDDDSFLKRSLSVETMVDKIKSYNKYLLLQQPISVVKNKADSIEELIDSIHRIRAAEYLNGAMVDELRSFDKITDFLIEKKEFMLAIIRQSKLAEIEDKNLGHIGRGNVVSSTLVQNAAQEIDTWDYVASLNTMLAFNFVRVNYSKNLVGKCPVDISQSKDSDQREIREFMKIVDGKNVYFVTIPKKISEDKLKEFIKTFSERLEYPINIDEIIGGSIYDKIDISNIDTWNMVAALSNLTAFNQVRVAHSDNLFKNYGINIIQSKDDGQLEVIEGVQSIDGQNKYVVTVPKTLSVDKQKQFLIEFSNKLKDPIDITKISASSTLGKNEFDPTGGVDLQNLEISSALGSTKIEFKELDLANAKGLTFDIISQSKLTKQQLVRYM